MRGYGEERSPEKEPISVPPTHVSPGLDVLSGMRVESPLLLKWKSTECGDGCLTL